MPRLLPLLLLAFLCSACALSAPPAESILAHADETVTADSSFAEIDRSAKSALQRSKDAPADVDAALAAASLLFQAADARMQRATLAMLVGPVRDDVHAMLGIDARIGDPTRTEILSLCTSGLEVSNRAVAAEPSRAAAQLHLGLHLSLVSWANGPARSVFAGYGPRLVDAIDRAIAADATIDGCAPLRLQGRFRSQAPWPYRDLAIARSELTRAVELAPLVVNHLFLGDALWLDGDKSGAASQWQAAATASGSESTRWSDDALRELAKLRLAAAAK